MSPNSLVIYVDVDETLVRNYGNCSTRLIEPTCGQLVISHKYKPNSLAIYLQSQCERMQQAASLQNPVFDVGALLAAPCICNLEILKIALRAKILVFLIGQKSPSGVHYLRCVYTKAQH